MNWWEVGVAFPKPSLEAGGLIPQYEAGTLGPGTYSGPAIFGNTPRGWTGATPVPSGPPANALNPSSFNSNLIPPGLIDRLSKIYGYDGYLQRFGDPSTPQGVQKLMDALKTGGLDTWWNAVNTQGFNGAPPAWNGGGGVDAGTGGAAVGNQNATLGQFGVGLAAMMSMLGPFGMLSALNTVVDPFGWTAGNAGMIDGAPGGGFSPTGNEAQAGGFGMAGGPDGTGVGY